MAKTEEKELTTQERLAKSSGADTGKYAAELEDQADALINEAYHPEQFEEDQKSKKETEEAETAKAKEEEANATEEETEGKKELEGEEKPTDEKKDDVVVDDEIKPDDDDTIERLKDKLEKSEQRVKDTRKVYSTSQKALKDERNASSAITEKFTETIEKLQSGIVQKNEADTKQEKKAADREIKETVVDLTGQFEKLNNIDPEIGASVREIVEGLTGQITGLNGQLTSLKTEIKTKEDNANKTAQEIANDEHYNAIDLAYPDWEETMVSDGFKEYKNSLSPRQKNLLETDLDDGSAENIIEIFSDYDEYSGKGESKENEGTDTKEDKLKRVAKMVGPNLNKAKEVKTTKRVKFTRAMIREESAKDPTWFERNEAEIDGEIAAGNIGI